MHTRLFQSLIATLFLIPSIATAATLSEGDFGAASARLSFIPVYTSMTAPTGTVSVDYREDGAWFATKKALIVTGEIDLRRNFTAVATQNNVLEIGSGLGKSTSTLLKHLIEQYPGEDIALHSLDDWRARNSGTTQSGVSLPGRKAPGIPALLGERTAPESVDLFLRNVLVDVMDARLTAGDILEDAADKINAQFRILHLDGQETAYYNASSDTPYIDAIDANKVGVAEYGKTGIELDTAYDVVFMDTDTESGPTMEIMLINAWNQLSDHGSLVIDDYGWVPPGGSGTPIATAVNNFIGRHYETITGETTNTPEILDSWTEGSVVDSKFARTYRYTSDTADAAIDGAALVTTSDGHPAIEFHNIWGEGSTDAADRWVAIIRRAPGSVNIDPL